MKYSRQQVREYREKLYEALLEVKSEGKQYLSEEEAHELAYRGSDKEVAEEWMRYSTPQELANAWTM